MNALKTKIINDIIEVEGGYSNNRNDSGGETKYGITKQVAIAYGYTGKMKDLPRSLAFQIYEDLFWKTLRLDEVCSLSDLIAAEIADTGVNMGCYRAARFLQRSLNVLNLKGEIYPDLKIDGVLGSQSVSALKDYLNYRKSDGESVLLKALNGLQTARYISLAEDREKDETFVYGWLHDRVA